MSAGGEPPPAWPRVCLPEGVRPGPLTLEGARARHLTGALRLRRGDGFLVFAGDGREYRARVDGTWRTRVTATVGELARQAPPPARAIEVWCANVRAPRMDWAVEKCVEAGADLFRAIVTERSARGTALAQGRLERWRRIAVEASEQCGRLHLPAIAPLAAFAEALAARSGTLLLASPRGAPCSLTASRTTFFVGPYRICVSSPPVGAPDRPPTGRPRRLLSAAGGTLGGGMRQNVS